MYVCNGISFSRFSVAAVREQIRFNIRAICRLRQSQHSSKAILRCLYTRPDGEVLYSLMKEQMQRLKILVSLGIWFEWNYQVLTKTNRFDQTKSIQFFWRNFRSSLSNFWWPSRKHELFAIWNSAQTTGNKWIISKTRSKESN